MDIKGKAAIVTGGGRGFGKAIALALHAEGVNVCLASPDVEEIDTVASEINSLGGKAISVKTDVRYADQIRNMVDKTDAEFGQVDILVNNGGVAVHSAIVDIQEDDWDFVLDVNLKGTMLCTQAVFGQMCERGSGHIINIGSGSGKVGSNHMGPYVASKFGVVGFTQVIDAEGFEHGVKATVINPGAADTLQRSQNHEDDRTQLLQPEDVADTVLFVLKQNPRAYTPEISVAPQFFRLPPQTRNLKECI